MSGNPQPTALTTSLQQGIRQLPHSLPQAMPLCRGWQGNRGPLSTLGSSPGPHCEQLRPGTAPPLLLSSLGTASYLASFPSLPSQPILPQAYEINPSSWVPAYPLFSGVPTSPSFSLSSGTETAGFLPAMPLARSPASWLYRSTSCPLTGDPPSN